MTSPASGLWAMKSIKPARSSSLQISAAWRMNVAVSATVIGLVHIGYDVRQWHPLASRSRRPGVRRHQRRLGGFESGCNLLHDLRQRCEADNSRRAKETLDDREPDRQG